jgi:hypothetical protein
MDFVTVLALIGLAAVLLAAAAYAMARLDPLAIHREPDPIDKAIRMARRKLREEERSRKEQLKRQFEADIMQKFGLLPVEPSPPAAAPPAAK